MMHMTFYWGRQVTILFDSWKTNTWLSYFLSLFFILLFSIFYQYLEDTRLRFKQASSSKSKSKSGEPNSTTPLLSCKITGSSLPKIAGAILFGVNSAIGYLLMLAVMSYNGGVLVAIVLGLALGYLFFRSSDEDDVVVDNPCACA